MVDFEEMKNAAFDSAAVKELADIRNVSVDRNLSKNERIAEYIKQIKNPYFFKCGKFTIKARYAENGVTLEDCLRGIIV